MRETTHIMDHPLVAHKMTILRDKNTSVKDFRELVSEIGMLITYEATRDLPLTTKTIETPLCKADMPTLAGKKFAVVPILVAHFSSTSALTGISLGGTSIIIAVGVALETVRALEAQMIMRNYKGFLS